MRQTIFIFIIIIIIYLFIFWSQAITAQHSNIDLQCCLCILVTDQDFIQKLKKNGSMCFVLLK
jgi:hypothetical protein